MQESVPASPRPRVRPLRRPAFTLVELLVVVVVIGILSAIVMGALQAARDTARTAKTRATISKLHNIIMRMYESYHTRRVAIYSNGVPVNTLNLNPSVVAQARLYALRDLMRMEMPAQWGDITNPPCSIMSLGTVPPPALYTYYNTRYTAQPPSTASTSGVDNESAKCLYLIVTYGCRARNQFNENEIGVDPADNYSMFVDGWGNPIYFMRWAPGFIYSDIQQVVAVQSGSQYVFNTAWAQQASQNDHDPFDPRQVDTTSGNGGPSGWRLVPLIYSYGPSGTKYGTKLGYSAAAPNPTNIYVNPAGAPLAGSDGQFHAADILSNHWIQGSSK